MHVASLQPLHDRAVLFTQLRQRQLADHLDREVGADRRWDADLETGALTFSQGDRAVVCGCHLTASIAPGPGTVRWGWALTGMPVPGTAAQALREHGESQGVPTLSEPEVPLQVLDGESPEDAATAASHELGSVVVAVTGRAPYYSAPTGDGRRVVFLLDVPDLAPLRIDPAAPTTLSAVIGSGAVADHRTAFHGLATLAGWSIAWQPGWTSATITDPVTGSTLAPRFDDAARLVELGGQLRS